MEFFDKEKKRIEFEKEISKCLGEQILSTKYMADRLDHISMMGLIYFFAKVSDKYQYTRYDHTLAVAHLTLKLCDKLKFSKTQKQLSLLAALSHDLGHGPFSHSSEAYLRWKAGTFKSHQKGDHPGKIEAMLRDSVKTLPQDLLSAFGDLKLLAQAVYLITQGKSIHDWGSDIPSGIDDVPKIFDSPLSPDVLDGDNRAFISLSHDHNFRLGPLDPEKMVDAISNYDEMLIVDIHGKSLIEQFSKLQEKFYSWVIHSKMVATGEAMLARAIELAYQDRKTSIGYTNLTDQKMIDQFYQNTKSAKLWDDITNRRLFVALSIENPELFDQVCQKYPLTEKTGEDFKDTKKRLEVWLAQRLKLDHDFIIAQVSQYLDWNPNYLRFDPITKAGPKLVTKWRVAWEESYGMPNYQNRRLEVYIPE